MELLTAEEVAKILKCSIEFVYKHRLELGGKKIGRLVRYQLNKIREVIGSGRETREDLEIRFSERRDETQKRRIQDKNGSDTGRSGSKSRSKIDKYGLLEALHRKA